MLSILLLLRWDLVCLLKIILNVIVHCLFAISIYFYILHRLNEQSLSGDCQFSSDMQRAWMLSLLFLQHKKSWTEWKSITFLEPIRKLSLQGKLPPWNLEKQANPENRSQDWPTRSRSCWSHTLIGTLKSQFDEFPEAEYKLAWAGATVWRLGSREMVNPTRILKKIPYGSGEDVGKSNYQHVREACRRLGNAGGMHHHRTNFNKYLTGYCGKVGVPHRPGTRAPAQLSI